MSSEVEKPWSPALSGSWLLNRESLSIEVMAPHEKRARKLVAVGRQPATSALTAKSEESNSLRWIPDMQTLLAPEGKKASVSPDCLAAARSCPITARLTIDDGRFISCHLAQGAEKGVYPYEFKLPEAGAQPVLVQAMSDAVMVTLEVPQGSKVQIVPRDLSIQSAKAKPKRTIELADGGQKEIDIWLTNAPDHHHMMDEDSCDGANMRIDRHFELYYNLLSGPVPFKQRVVPSQGVTAASGKSVAAMQPQGENRCPLLTFQPSSSPSPGSAHRTESRGDRYPTDLRSCGNIMLSAP